MFLLLGSHSALLIDTGCGLFPIKPTIDSLIADRKLVVVNTHAHWDHIGGNHEFNEIYIHEDEANIVAKPVNLSLLIDSSKEIVSRYNRFSFSIPPAAVIKTLKEGDIFDLGELTIKNIHTPGHSLGSISFFTDKGELFTGDTAHYGAVFLPKKNKFPILISSLLKLIEIQNNTNITDIYPSHEQIHADYNLLIDLNKRVSNIEQLWEKRKKNDFLHSWVIDGGKFQFVISRF